MRFGVWGTACAAGGWCRCNKDKGEDERSSCFHYTLLARGSGAAWCRATHYNPHFTYTGAPHCILHTELHCTLFCTLYMFVIFYCISWWFFLCYNSATALILATLMMAGLVSVIFVKFCTLLNIVQCCNVSCLTLHSGQKDVLFLSPPLFITLIFALCALLPYFAVNC